MGTGGSTSSNGGTASTEVATEVPSPAKEGKGRKSRMATGLLARLEEGGGVSEPVANLVSPEQQVAEANLNQVLAAAMSREVAEAMPPVEEAIKLSNRVVVLPVGAEPDFEVVEVGDDDGEQLG